MGRGLNGSPPPYMAQTPNVKGPEGDHRRRTAVAVPRAWLIALTMLVVFPWLVLSAWYAWEEDLIGDLIAPVAAPEPVATADPGPWGRLTVTPIVISPPLEYVSTDWGPPGPPVWYFPNMTADQIQGALVGAGLPAGTAASIRTTAVPESRINGLAVQPSPAVVAALSPEVRASLYTLLARTRANYAQLHPFRFEAPTSDGWFRGSLIAPGTREQVDPLLYRDGAFLFFADLALLRDRLDREELRRLMKTLYRQSTVLASLAVPAEADLEGLAEYWGRGGRRTDLRPLLESVVDARGERAIDITHLLPAFARNHLYRYPEISPADLARPIIANCLWSALNFFSAEPDDRFLDVPYALERLREDYHVIQHGLELGDLIAFVDAEGDLFHIAVYVADDLVFTKNGTTPMAPWTLMSLASLQGYYRPLVSDPRLIYHRRNDF